MKKKIVILAVIILAILNFFWFFGIRYNMKPNEIEKIIANGKLVIAVYENQGSGKVWIQSVNKLGIQTTVFAEGSSGYIIKDNEKDFLSSIETVSYCKVNLVKPWYYSKLMFFLKKYSYEFKHSYWGESCVDSPNTYSGYIRFNDIASNKYLNYDAFLNNFGHTSFWEYICKNSNIKKYIDKKDIMPSLFRKEYNYKSSRNALEESQKKENIYINSKKDN